ncbi:uncharacterized protein LOC121858788 [Homarus americanus]|uniref:uncharacterized protein LOC121858788 n=1 Tax=Homarus americanus TaxID=6706 RepID=UPI001C461FB6|nr:uncharacterized protein LOC121858788 [Homarus americanus]
MARRLLDSEAESTASAGSLQCHTVPPVPLPSTCTSMNKEGEDLPPSPSKGKMPSVSFGTAAFILIRVKRAFKKKRAKLKSFPDLPEYEETQATSSVKEGGVVVSRPPLVRSRTLPAIVVPGVTVLQTALDASDRRDAGSTSRHQVVPADSPVRPLLTVTTFGKWCPTIARGVEALYWSSQWLGCSVLVRTSSGFVLKVPLCSNWLVALCCEWLSGLVLVLAYW